jgi:CsbD-like
VEGNWKQVKGKVKEKWGQLTDDDIDMINSRRDQLVGKIQEPLGFGQGLGAHGHRTIGTPRTGGENEPNRPSDYMSRGRDHLASELVLTATDSQPLAASLIRTTCAFRPIPSNRQGLAFSRGRRGFFLRLRRCVATK